MLGAMGAALLGATVLGAAVHMPIVKVDWIVFFNFQEKMFLGVRGVRRTVTNVGGVIWDTFSFFVISPIKQNKRQNTNRAKSV